MLTSKEIRSGFIEFFKTKEHKFIPSSPIVPIGDETLLFANAGMNQFKDIFTGLAKPDCKRAANSQKCLRVSGKHNDLEEVGKDTYHHTFFEMLGNWSFGDYFKAEAIEWAWELLTQVWGIERDKLWVSIFEGDEKDNIPKDEEAAKLWTKLTPIQAERVLAFGKKDNFWEMGNVGPCGPCSEIHIDLGPDRCDMKDVPGHKCAVNCGCSRFIELWNLVFIQYNRSEDGKLTPLKAKYIDTGAGLERVAAVLQNKKSNYDTDLFMPIIEAEAKLSGRKYTSQIGNKTDNAFRVIADHTRALVFAITDGATPSNDGRGYVIRRILRRAARFGRVLGMHEPFIYKLVPVVVDYLGEAFPEIKQRADHVSTVIESEEESFGKTIDRGIEIFNSAAEKAQKTKIIEGQNAFQLYDTYGFPLDLTCLMARERNLQVDTAGFEKLMSEQRQRARSAQKKVSFMANLSETQLPATEDVHKYEKDKCGAKIVGVIDNEGFRAEGEIEKNTKGGLVLDKTCFYAEAGGQVGDCGTIETKDAKFAVEDTVKIANCIVHHGKVIEGNLKIGDDVEAIVSKDRQAIKKNHTATHILQWALQQVKGEAVAQQGSLVCVDYLRFDFTCPKALTEKEMKKVEQLVKAKIAEDLPVNCSEMSIEEAKKLGAMALFGEKYGEIVRVVGIGANNDTIEEAFSKEFCGGTHIDRIGKIGGFKIIKEESISAGVRRITAMTGQGLNEYLEKRSDIVDELLKMLKVPENELLGRVEKIITDNKELTKKLKNASQQSGSDVLTEAKKLLEKSEKIGDVAAVVGKLSTTSIEQARLAVDMIKKRAKSTAIVFALADGDKVTLLAAVSDDLIKKGLKAGDIVKQIAPIVEGGGGGRPQMAQAGGKNPEKIDDALKQASLLIREKLKN